MTVRLRLPLEAADRADVVGASGRRREADSAGFSMVEVLVAMVVLEVGLLAAMGMTLQAQRTLRTAFVLETVSDATEAVADSMTRFGWNGSGRRVMDEGTLRWSSAGLDVITISFDGRGDLSAVVAFPLRVTSHR